jgi:hypothetical protein
MIAISGRNYRPIYPRNRAITTKLNRRNENKKISSNFRPTICLILFFSRSPKIRSEQKHRRIISLINKTCKTKKSFGVCVFFFSLARIETGKWKYYKTFQIEINRIERELFIILFHHSKTWIGQRKKWSFFIDKSNIVYIIYEGMEKMKKKL